MSMFENVEAGRAVNRVTRVSLREVGHPAAPKDTHVVGEVLALDHLRGARGDVRVGALLTMADTVGGMCAGLAALPGWVVSTNLMLRTDPVRHVGPLALDGRVLRAGRTSVVIQVQIRDSGDGDRLIADGVLTSAVLDPAGGPPDFGRPMVMHAPDGPDPAVPVLEFFGIEPAGDGTVVMEITEGIKNPWGILHGGATAVLLDAAAAHAIGPDATTADVVMHFLRPGRVGPAVAHTQVLGERPDGHVVRVEIVDAGADDRVMVVAVATVR
jgi:uncharacterized protein (TIGR00369 family)